MPASPAFGLNQIRQISVNVQDPERATAFYRDALGMKYLFAAGPLTFFDCGGIRLMLARPERPELDHPGSILYFSVTDIHEAQRTLAERGVRFQDKPQLIAKLETVDVWLADFRDSENNLLALMSEAPRA